MARFEKPIYLSPFIYLPIYGPFSKHLCRLSSICLFIDLPSMWSPITCHLYASLTYLSTIYIHVYLFPYQSSIHLSIYLPVMHFLTMYLSIIYIAQWGQRVFIQDVNTEADVLYTEPGSLPNGWYSPDVTFLDPRRSQVENTVPSAWEILTVRRLKASPCVKSKPWILHRPVYHQPGLDHPCLTQCHPKEMEFQETSRVLGKRPSEVPLQ